MTIHLENGKKKSLIEVVQLACDLCDIIYGNYRAIWEDVQQFLMCHLAQDAVDGDEELDNVMSKLNGELYLQHLSYMLSRQEMFMIDKEKGCVEFSEYISCRQKCLYGCFCFVILFLCVYNSDNFINMKNVDWVLGTVMPGGCNMLEFSDSMGREKVSQAVVLLLGGGKKSISKCIFDLVNMLNPSGGLVGPGNSMWFHNAVLCVCGMVGRHWKKDKKSCLYSQHMCIFDAAFRNWSWLYLWLVH